MSHWDTCCLYKETEIISTFSLVPVYLQGVEGLLCGFINITLHVIQRSKYSTSVDFKVPQGEFICSLDVNPS